MYKNNFPKFSVIASLFLGFFLIHGIEDTIWIVVSRYTDLPLWTIYIGLLFWVSLVTVWALIRLKK